MDNDRAKSTADVTPAAADYDARLRNWERKVPWFRRISARTGLQGKLVLSFMFLLVVTLGTSSSQFVSESRQVTEDVLGAKAQTIAGMVAVSAENALATADAHQLAAIGRKLLANQDIIALAFFSHSRHIISSAWRDGDPTAVRSRLIPNPRQNPEQTLRT